MTLKDIGKKIDEFFKQKPVAPIPQNQIVKSPQPTFMDTVGNFVQKQAGNYLSGKNVLGQQLPFNIASNPFAPAPRVNLVDKVGSKAPGANFLLKTAAAIPQDILNAPSDIQRAGVQTYKDFKSGAIKKPQVAISNAAKFALPIATLATMGGGSIAKSVGKTAAKEAFKSLPKAVIKGTAQGAGYGGAFGTLQGLSEGREREGLDFILNTLKNTAGGAALGGVAGGGVGGVGNLAGRFINHLKGTLTARGIPQDQQTKIINGYLRYVGTGKFASTQKLTPQKGKFLLKQQINKKLGRDLDESVYYGDLNESLGFPRDFNAGKNEGFINPSAFFPSKGTKQQKGALLPSELNKGLDVPQANQSILNQPQSQLRNASNLNIQQRPTVLPQAAIKFKIKEANKLDNLPLQQTIQSEIPQTKVGKPALPQSMQGQFSRELKANETSVPLKPNIAQEQESIKQFETMLDEWPKPTISTDKASQIRAEASTELGNMGKGGFGGLVPEVKTLFQDWVNARHATKVEGYLKNKEFADLNNKGMEGFFEFQAGNKTGRYGDVKKYFDNKYHELQKNGVEFHYKSDYLPQLWNNTPEEIQQVFGRSLGTRPSFTLESVIKNYQEGLNAGLKPKFSTIGELAGWYEERANKALADVGFFNKLGKDAMIQPSNKAPQNWVTIDPDRFPKVTVNIDNKEYRGVYKAPPELASAINNYLRDPQFKFLEAVSNYVSRVKNVTLNFGIPGTAINAHGINTLARHTLFGTGSNPISRFLTASKYMVYPNSAQAYLDKELIRAPQAVKNGLSMSAEDYTGVGKQAENLAGQFSKKWENVFGTPLFNKMIPALKLSSYEKLVKDGMNPKDSAKLVNNVYGGINWEQLGRNRDMQNLFRSMFLAPDWGETSLRLGGNFIKAANPLHKSVAANRYRAMMATFLASYIGMNITNKLSSGHYAYENDPGHIFELEIGYTEDGQRRYLRPYGTAADMIRVPFDIASGLIKGDALILARTIRNRLSIPIGVGVGAITDTDYRGNTIGYRGTDKFGNEMPLEQRATNIGGEIASLVGVPSFLRQFTNSASGQQGWEQGLTQGFELPVRYQNPGNSKTQKFVGGVSKLEGEKLFKLKKRFQGESPFSENQQSLIEQGGLPTLENVMEVRQQNRLLRQSKKIQEQAANGEVTPEEAQRSLDELLKTQAPVKKQTTTGTNQAHAAGNQATQLKNKLQEQNIKNKVLISGKAQASKDTYYYLNDSGNVASIPLDRPIYQAKLSGSEELDKLERKKQISSYTDKINDVQKLYELGVLTAEKAEEKINSLQEEQKGAKGGGKGKKGRKITIKTINIQTPKATIKTSRRKAPTFKLKKAPTFKLTKSKAVRKFKLKKSRNTLTN